VSQAWKIALSVIVLFAVVLTACGVYLILRFKTFSVPSNSMAPTVHVHDVFVADMFAYRDVPPQRGDVVVFTPPIRSQNPFFKRVVAVPGDRLAIRGGRTFVNGKRVDEPYVPQGTPYDLAVRDYDIWVDGARLDHAYAVVPPRALWTAQDTVPRGCYVLLGDNRINSEDSHSFGFVCPGQPAFDPSVHPQLLARAILPSR
jgi:signal peptidase I